MRRHVKEFAIELPYAEWKSVSSEIALDVLPAAAMEQIYKGTIKIFRDSTQLFWVYAGNALLHDLGGCCKFEVAGEIIDLLQFGQCFNDCILFYLHRCSRKQHMVSVFTHCTSGNITSWDFRHRRNHHYPQPCLADATWSPAVLSHLPVWVWSDSETLHLSFWGLLSWQRSFISVGEVGCWGRRCVLGF